MTNELLPCIELGTDEADYTIIWLHGLGADGHDFEPIVPQLNLPATTKIRFVFPHAPSRPITINNGMVMPAWYDIASPQLDQIEDEAGIRRSLHYLEQLIQRETERGIKSENIILAGFSQGGAIALYTGLRYSQPLAGIIALSTYLPLAQTTSREASEANRQIPILLAHGSHDPIIPLRLAEGSRHYLEQLGYKPEWKIYFMEHSVCPDEIRDISRWLIQLIAG